MQVAGSSVNGACTVKILHDATYCDIRRAVREQLTVMVVSLYQNGWTPLVAKPKLSTGCILVLFKTATFAPMKGHHEAST